MQVVLNYMKHNQVKNGNYNDLFNRMYLTCLDYKAACYQGRAKGRQFLVAMQKSVIDKGESYSIELGSQLAQQVGLDLTMLKMTGVLKWSKRNLNMTNNWPMKWVPKASPLR